MNSSSPAFGVTGADGLPPFTVNKMILWPVNQYVRPVVSADDRIQQITGHVYRHNQPGYATGKLLGHMLETFTTRSGIALRPLLTAEFIQRGQSTMANNESWLF